MSIGADGAQRGDGALHAPQQQARLRLGLGTRVGQRPGYTRRGEGEQQGRDERLLDQLAGAAGGDDLVVADPVGQGVDVPVGGEIRRNHPQARTGGGVLAIQVLGEGQALVRQARAGRHHGGAAGQQLADDRRGDGARCDAGDHGDVIGPANRLVTGHGTPHRRGGDGLGDRRALRSPRRTRLVQAAGPPGRLIGNGPAQAGEALRGEQCACPVQRRLTIAQTSQVLARRGPAVVDENGAVGVEGRRHRAEPSGAQLGIDGLDQGARGGGLVVRVGGNGDPVRQPQGRQDGARGGRQHTVLAGDGGGEGVQGRGVHHRAPGAARGAGLGDGGAVRRGHVLHRLVDERVHGAGTPHGGGGPEGGEVIAPHGGALTGAQEQVGGDVGDPPLAQTPGALDALGDTGRAHARRTEKAAQAGADGVGQDRAEGLVAGGPLGHGGRERRHVGVCGAIDAGELELGAHVHQELVAPRGHAIGQGLGGVRRADLLGADARGVRQEHGERVRGGEGQIVSRTG